MAALLTQLNSTKLPYLWTTEAEEVFAQLKQMFSMAPVLAHPDPGLQFVVEVDASNTGVAA